MTHLSDFSYLARSFGWVFLFIYLVHSIYKGDKFKCLHYKSILYGELKSIVTLLIIGTMTLQLTWDIVSCYIKYTEGFMAYIGPDQKQHIVGVPFNQWSATHRDIMVIMDYVICVTFSLEVGVFFLMQTFWNYLSNRVAKRSFMGSFEFKFYIVMACCSIVIFPTLQYVYRNDVNKREAIPQLAFGTEALFVSLLGIRSHIRFSRIIGISQRNGHAGNKGIVNKLSYFKDMNVVLSLCLGGFAVAMIILCIDGLTVEKVINHNKFAADFLIAFANICTLFLYQAIISVFHPRPQYLNKSDETTTSGNESNFQLSTAPKTEDGRRTAFGDHHSDSDMKSGINQSNGGFMRAMSPVHVDHPYTNDTLPLTSNAAALSNRTFSPVDNKPSYNKSHNIEVEDPYNCEPVMFTMVDIASKKQQQQQRYAIPSSPTSVSSHSSIPQNMQNRVKSPMRKYNDDDSYEMSYQSEKSSRYRQPSWDHREDARSPPTSPGSPNNAAKQPNDWLWQSPDRRNP